MPSGSRARLHAFCYAKTRIATPSRRSRKPQNSAYERATTLSRTWWKASQAAWPRRAKATR